MRKLRLLLLKWKMGFKCILWLIKYRKEKLAMAKVYLCSPRQNPHASEVFYIIDSYPGPCYMSKFTKVKEKQKTIFSPTCYKLHGTKRVLYNPDGDNHRLNLAPFSFVGMESGLSLLTLKKTFKGHNVQFLYNTVVRL